MKHKHAELMLKYAQDAMTSETPWENWECKHTKQVEWSSIAGHPIWENCYDYRRKPKTININGHEVPEPMDVYPTYDSFYYAVSLTRGVNAYTWYEDALDLELWNNGLVHATKEAAEQHYKALISFTKK